MTHTNNTEREDKYRAWDIKEKQMSIGMPLEWFIFGNDADMEFPDNDTTLPLQDFKAYREDFILTKFTGLTDKNVKEIYEGDIVKDWRTERYGEVKFGYYSNMDGEYYPSCYGYFIQWNRKHTSDDTMQDMLLMQAGSEYTIAGNIYQSPELLNTQQPK